MPIVQFRLNGDTDILTYKFKKVSTFEAFRNLFVAEDKVLTRIDEFISNLEDDEVIKSEDDYNDLIDDFEINLSDNGESMEYVKLIKLK